MGTFYSFRMLLLACAGIAWVGNARADKPSLDTDQIALAADTPADESSEVLVGSDQPVSQDAEDGAIIAGADEAMDDVQIYGVIYGGNGCPGGTAHVLLTPDRTQLTILFDAYSAEPQAPQTLDRRSCNIAVSLRVPPGFSVGLWNLDYRGYYSIPWRGAGELSAEYFFAGSVGPLLSHRFPSGNSGNFLVRHSVPFVSWSRCGEDVLVRSNTGILARRPVFGTETALVSVDSIDARGVIIFHLNWRRC